MRTTQYLLATQKEKPADAELISHQLMIRAGLIRPLSVSGLYTWLPTGFRVLNKVVGIVREEMAAIGALEVLLPMVQPEELWEESQRLASYGPELLRFKDRHRRAFVLGPTHEAVITDLAKKTLLSYKQLPTTCFQIQTKFRDERRPRFGVMRAREFLMKDAYSFHLSPACLQQTYDAMHGAYQRIFARLSLTTSAVLADSGQIGGIFSHEFQALAESGEDLIAYSTGSSYAANVEQAEAIPKQQERAIPTQALTMVSCAPDTTLTSLQPDIKLILVKAAPEGTTPFVGLILCQAHSLNAVKVEKLPEVLKPLCIATPAEVQTHFGVEPERLSPLGLAIPCFVDRSAAMLSDFTAVGNGAAHAYQGINWDRDLPLPPIRDLRLVQDGDLSPDGLGTLQLKRGIEVGHLFQLGTQYSMPMNALIQSTDAQAVPLLMGCYGLGISRVIAAVVEQHHDAKGIRWPESIAPFTVALVALEGARYPEVEEQAERLYQALIALQIDVLFDDRKERPGTMLADMELLGIPHCLIVGRQGLQRGVVEYRARPCLSGGQTPKAPQIEWIERHAVIEFIRNQLTGSHALGGELPVDG